MLPAQPTLLVVVVPVTASDMKNEDKEAIALWRLGVLGPLVSARLGHGDRTALIREAAARDHQMPDGRIVRVKARTIAGWFYSYRHGGWKALMPATRSDCASSRAIRPEVAEFLLRAKRQKPRRSIYRLVRMMERAGLVRPGELSKSSVHRLLVAAGVSKRPARNGGRERRSFLPEHAGDVWMGDAMHGPPVIASGGKVGKSYMLTQLDGATRFIPHSYFAMSEGAAAQEHGFRQAILKYGPPLVYYVDLGSAYIAHSLRVGCAEIGTRLLHTGVRDCEAKGAIERFHRTWREQVGDELPDRPLPLHELNAIHWAWLGTEYHQRVHDTTGRRPRDHFLEQADRLRPIPPGIELDDVFLHRVKRRVRKDGTLRFLGKTLEVRPELVGQLVELRHLPGDDALPRVFIDGKPYCDTVVLDRVANTTRRRRHIRPSAEPDTPDDNRIEPLGQMREEHYRMGRIGDDPDDEEN